MALKSRQVEEYYVFLASPGDMDLERQAVRRFFDEYNRHTASSRGVRFTVIDYENYATAGIGRPQELITNQTLARYRDSLALVIGLMGQRFGSPTGTHESGTEEEFEWAFNSYQQTSFPEIKWFFRKVDEFKAPSDPKRILEALEQWEKVRAFRERLQTGSPPVFYKEFTDTENFRDVLREDLSLWLNAPERPWANAYNIAAKPMVSQVEVSPQYYENIVQDFQWLDIAGIDNDRAFRIPLSDMYVRLRVMLDEDTQADNTEDIQESGQINIQTALERYRKLVIVGDPGSGKSTFLKFISLMIARSVLEGNPGLALERLSLESPLLVPIFLPCWDLSDFIRRKEGATIKVLTEFIAERFAAMGNEFAAVALEYMLAAGSCCLLFDGLDEVPTEQGRAVVSRLVEKFVARYPENRYVITSRVRAYTGDTMLQGEFTRCDIQEFSREERNEFLQNWFALLFKVPREVVTVSGSDSFKAFDSLQAAIERNDRIRALAVNPLLLTVVAIVHWNRKRLPEQRVDLYDECVDVLIGQRKEAEQIQRTKKAEVLDEKNEEKTHDDRKWVRKRISEIALQILLSEDEEITKSRVIEILHPRFFDRGARNNEEADGQAEMFLDRQELRSGLLVSRRSNSYRFVHLTFQEYLAAWNLATQELADVKGIVGPHLREQKWFETLQLLGDEWAKRSDEILDGYVAYLLEQQGTSITERAPVIALCANILNDTSGVAAIKPTTRRNYNKALQGTLQAFHRYSRVPAKVQLEILEALGQLGAAVKDHLISATHSAYYPVRSRAIEMLVPHLPDDDLFNMRHILRDRSQETIRTYLSSLLDRDLVRTERMLTSEKGFEEKAANAIAMLFPRLVEGHSAEKTIALGTNLLAKMVSWAGQGKSILLHHLARYFPQHKRIWELITQCAREDKDGFVRRTALELLARWRGEEATTWELITQCAREDKDGFVCYMALELLVKHYRLDNRTLIILSRDLDGYRPYLDFSEPIRASWVEKCAVKLQVSVDEIWAMFRKLADILPLNLDIST